MAFPGALNQAAGCQNKSALQDLGLYPDILTLLGNVEIDFRAECFSAVSETVLGLGLHFCEVLSWQNGLVFAFHRVG